MQLTVHPPRQVTHIPELAVGGRDASPAEDVEAGLGAVKVTVVRIEAEPDVGNEVVELHLRWGRKGVWGRTLGCEGHRADRGQGWVDRWPICHLNNTPHVR